MKDNNTVERTAADRVAYLADVAERGNMSSHGHWRIFNGHKISIRRIGKRESLKTSYLGGLS